MGVYLGVGCQLKDLRRPAKLVDTLPPSVDAVDALARLGSRLVLGEVGHASVRSHNKLD